MATAAHDSNAPTVTRPRPRPAAPTSHRVAEADPLDRLIGKLYEAAVHPHGLASFLEALAREVHADAMTLLATSVDGGELREIAFSVETDPQAEADYREYFSSIDPWVAAGVLDQPVGAAAASERIVSESDLVRTEFYTDYYRPNGWHHGFGAKLLHDADGIVASVTGHRHKNAGCFDDNEVQLLERLVPHLQRVLRLRRQLELMSAERDAGAQLLDRVSMGVILADERGRIVRSNQIADEILAANDGLRSSAEGLEAATAQQTAELRYAISEAARTSRGNGTGAGGRMSLRRPSGGRPLSGRSHSPRSKRRGLGNHESPGGDPPVRRQRRRPRRSGRPAQLLRTDAGRGRAHRVAVARTLPRAGGRPAGRQPQYRPGPAQAHLLKDPDEPSGRAGPTGPAGSCRLQCELTRSASVGERSPRPLAVGAIGLRPCCR